MRDVERVLIIGSALGSVFFGAAHYTPWLVAPAFAFTGLLIAEDRAVNRRIGSGTWPSVGYARFLFGTNLYLTLRNTVLSAAIFAIASTVGSLLGR